WERRSRSCPPRRKPPRTSSAPCSTPAAPPTPPPGPNTHSSPPATPRHSPPLPTDFLARKWGRNPQRPSPAKSPLATFRRIHADHGHRQLRFGIRPGIRRVLLPRASRRGRQDHLGRARYGLGRLRPAFAV